MVEVSAQGATLTELLKQVINKLNDLTTQSARQSGGAHMAGVPGGRDREEGGGSGGQGGVPPSPSSPPQPPSSL